MTTFVQPAAHADLLQGNSEYKYKSIVDSLDRRHWREGGQPSDTTTTTYNYGSGNTDLGNTVSDSPGSDNVRWARYPRLTAHRAMPDTIPRRVAM